MAIDKEFMSMVYLGAGFLFVNGAFVAQQEIQNEVITSYASLGYTMNDDAGYYSQSIYYVGFALSALFTAPLITSFGPKHCIVVSTVIVFLYMLTFLFLNEILMYIMSFFAGAALGIMRSARGHYLAIISTPSNIARNTSVFWFTYFIWQPLSAAFLYGVLYGQDILSVSRIRLIYGLLMCAVFIGLLFLWLPLPNVEAGRRRAKTDAGAKHRTRAMTYIQEHPQESKWKKFWKFTLSENVKMFRLACTRWGLVLLFIFLSTSVQVVLTSSVYPSSLGFTQRLNFDGPTVIALHNLCMGVASIVISPVVGIWSKKAGRAPVYMGQMILALIVYLLMFINLPEDAPLGPTDERGFMTPSPALALICSFLMGIYNSMGANANTANIAALYPGDESAQAFGWCAFVQTFFAIFISLYASKLILGYQCLIASILAILAGITEFPLEWKAQANPKGLNFD